jgi:serine/threonine-protein kinase
VLHPALDRDRIDLRPAEYLGSVGEVFAEYGEQTQDSGNLSYGLRIEGARYFVKTAGRVDDPEPRLGHPARVELLRNAARLHASCAHRAFPRLHRVIESVEGPLLVYDWFDGELLGAPRERRADPGSAFRRFRGLPVPAIEACLEVIFDAHVELAKAGWIAVDFYDGCLMYDFASGRLAIVDLDMYRRGAFRNDMGRMFGSTRFMAPEEHERAALIDERTNVFTMGRTAFELLGEGAAFRGSPEQLEVATRACRPDRGERFASLGELGAAWRGVRDGEAA